MLGSPKFASASLRPLGPGGAFAGRVQLVIPELLLSDTPRDLALAVGMSLQLFGCS